MRVLFVQGAGATAHDDWDATLVASLARALDAPVRYPRMPDEANPRFGAWSATLVRELGDCGIAVGHSVGGTILLHTLAAHPHPLRALALIAAPFIGPGGWPSDDLAPLASFAAPYPIFLYHGTADETDPVAHVDLYAQLLPRAVVRRLAGRNHQLDDDLRAVADDLRAYSTAASK